MTPDERAWWSTFCTQRLSDMGERRAFLSCIRAAVAEEREACARTVETLYPKKHSAASENSDFYDGQDAACCFAADEIRARGGNDE